MKRHISTKQIIEEFDLFEDLAIITINKQTGKRLATIHGCNLHRAFAEMANNSRREIPFYIFPTKFAKDKGISLIDDEIENYKMLAREFEVKWNFGSK